MSRVRRGGLVWSLWLASLCVGYAFIVTSLARLSLPGAPRGSLPDTARRTRVWNFFRRLPIRIFLTPPPPPARLRGIYE